MYLIDTFPTNEINGLKYRVGRVFPFGATLIGDGIVNFSIFSKEAVSCSLVLFRKGEKEPFVEIPFPEEFRIGNVYTMMVFGITIETTEYGYRFDGVYDPSIGLRFDKNKILLDPYAKSVSGRSIWGELTEPASSFIHRGQIIHEDYDWDGDKPLEIPMEDLVIYEMHVRGFTKDPSSNIKYGGTYAGIVEKIPYLKSLGINCIELMPVFAFDEFEYTHGKSNSSRLNYWGYSTLCFFAPKAGYAASGPSGMEADEFKNMVKKLHKNGISIILDVVFNHTAEGNEEGPVISYKGIDNR
ncbi:MAG: alpha-amylase family glycosyl hydrolase, partial [Lachnospiraceae bacterium]|nr:alpha-amylase family glycosyl hydrolase [Lachnospiraceae bacterium]